MAPSRAGAVAFPGQSGARFQSPNSLEERTNSGDWGRVDIGSAGGIAGIIPEMPELELAHPDEIL
jgi:hypothetical protein